DIVTIKLGSNDSKPPNWDAAKYEADYREMSETLQALPSEPTVILIRSGPAFSDNFSIRNEVIANEIIPIVDRLGVEFGLRVIDLYNGMREHGATFPDGIHPSAEGSRIAAEQIAPFIREAAEDRAADAKQAE